MVFKELKEVFLKNAFRFFILSILWPIGFFFYNEVLHGQIDSITFGRIIAYFGPMITLPFIGYLLQERYEKTEDLEKTTQKIYELLLNVIKKKQLGIRYENPNLVKCWEISKCGKKDCPAYNSINLRCWQIAGTYCLDKPTGIMAQKIDDCRNCSVYKISTPDELTAIGENFNNMMLILENMSAEQYKDFMATIEALSKLIEIKDPYTGGKHSATVQRYALCIANLLNLSPEQIINIKIASILHDIGKIGIKGSILNKNGPLDNMEYKEIKKHPLIGEEAIKSIKKLNDVRAIIRYHHERFDGKMDGKYSSYTGEVKGEDIPIESRIISIADSYDAMTSDRPYRKALTKVEAVNIIKKERGQQFDPKIVDVFLKILEEDKINS
ncbi:MAG: HD domain-containing protein [Candidatus Firestonebacteria bacterium]|nr:HD domain-containing protein [Candidatus Firestonebacteria bacterium]